MPDASDGLVGSEALVCEVTGVSQPLRHKWIEKYGLRRRPRGAYEDFDVRELAALRCILDTLGPGDGGIAWHLIREQLVDVWDASPLVLLFDLQDKEATLVTLMPALAEALAYGHRVLAARLDDPLARASRAFVRAVGGSR